MSVSEVAMLLQQLDAICLAMYRGSDDSSVGKHAFLTRQYERLAQTQEELASHLGKEQALQEVIDALERSEREQLRTLWNGRT
jgi:hypothetical protein